MKINSQKFNLIEILISMVVIIFAMFIMISFIPLAQNQTSKSINMNQAANFSEHFISFLKNTEIDDIISTFPLAGDFDKTQDTSRSDYPSFNDSEGSEWDDDGSTHLYPASSNAKGLFKIVSYSTINNVKVKEAEIEARVWLSDDIQLLSAYGTDIHNKSLSPKYFDNLDEYKNSATDQSRPPKVVRINIEFSWPLNKPYSKRTKSFFFYEVMTNKYQED